MSYITITDYYSNFGSLVGCTLGLIRGPFLLILANKFCN